MEGKGKGKDKDKKAKAVRTMVANLEGNPRVERLQQRRSLHHTKVGECLRCAAKGHSVAECLRPRRDNPNRPGDKPGGNHKDVEENPKVAVEVPLKG
eukprot:4303961-Amphidinium_carterae.1